MLPYPAVARGRVLPDTSAHRTAAHCRSNVVSRRRAGAGRAPGGRLVIRSFAEPNGLRGWPLNRVVSEVSTAGNTYIVKDMFRDNLTDIPCHGLAVASGRSEEHTS